MRIRVIFFNFASFCKVINGILKLFNLAIADSPLDIGLELLTELQVLQGICKLLDGLDRRRIFHSSIDQA